MRIKYYDKFLEEFEYIYKRIVVEHSTLNKVASELGSTSQSLYYRVNQFKWLDPTKYQEIKMVLKYNKERKFCKSKYWKDYDNDDLYEL